MATGFQDKLIRWCLLVPIQPFVALQSITVIYRYEKPPIYCSFFWETMIFADLLFRNLLTGLSIFWGNKMFFLFSLTGAWRGLNLLRFESIPSK